jgi:hypothetical protein
MVSAIDTTLPVYGNPTTQSVRNNFSTAKSEISALQTATVGGPFLPIAGGTVTGPVTFSNQVIVNSSLSLTGGGLVVGNNTTAQQIYTNGPAGSSRNIVFQSAGVIRWRFSGNNTAETGTGNAGSDLDLIAFSDAGTANPGTPVIRVIRSSGSVLLNSSTDAGYRLDVNGTGRFIGGINATPIGATTASTGAFTTLTTSSTTTHNNVVNINGAAATLRQILFQTAASNRWRITANNVAEGGANAGSDIDIANYDDTGTIISNPIIKLVRSSGLVTVYYGLSCFSTFAASNTDLSRHISLYSNTYGLNVLSNRLNIIVPSAAGIYGNVGGTDILSIVSAGLRVIGNVGFYNTAPIAKPTVSGAWAGNTAGKALSTALASLGLITDSTTA